MATPAASLILSCRHRVPQTVPDPILRPSGALFGSDGDPVSRSSEEHRRTADAAASGLIAMWVAWKCCTVRIEVERIGRQLPSPGKKEAPVLGQTDRESPSASHRHVGRNRVLFSSRLSRRQSCGRLLWRCAWNSHTMPRYFRARNKITAAEARVLIWSMMNTGSRRCTASAPTSTLLKSHIAHARLLTPAEQCSRPRWITCGTYAATEIAIPTLPRISNTVCLFDSSR